MDQFHQPLLINEEIEHDTGPGEATEGAVVSSVEDQATEQSTAHVIIPKGRSIIIEPVMLLYCLGNLGNDPLLEQYTHFRFSNSFPVLHNTSGAGNASRCSAANSSNPYVIAEVIVNEDTSVWQTYLALPSLLSMIMSIIYGAYSDHVGRRPVLLLPSICGLIKFTINSFVIYYDLPLYLLVISSCIEASGGGYFTLITAVYSYLADCISTEKLGIRMTIADGIIAVSSGICIVALGYSIKQLGYFYTYIILAGCMVMNVVYIAFFVPETISRDRAKSASIHGYLKSIAATFTSKEDQRHLKIFLLMLAYLFCNFIVQSQTAIQILFAMGPPLCWSAVTIGIYFGAGIAFVELTGIAGLALFEWCKVPEIVIAVIGILSIAIGCLVNAFADSMTMMILVALSSMFALLPPAMIRTSASVMLKDDEQGRVLSAFSAIGALGYVFSMMAMNTVYQHTVDFMEGFVFVIEAGVCLLCLIVLMIFIVFTRKRKGNVEEEEGIDQTASINT